MKLIISILLGLSATPAFAADSTSTCQCTEALRHGQVQGVNLWVYWTDAIGQRHHDLVGNFSDYFDCRAEARARVCPLR